MSLNVCGHTLGGLGWGVLWLLIAGPISLEAEALLEVSGDPGHLPVVSSTPRSRPPLGKGPAWPVRWRDGLLTMDTAIRPCRVHSSFSPWKEPFFPFNIYFNTSYHKDLLFIDASQIIRVSLG